MPIRRQIKNVVRSYTDAERKVREATSNDPWGPSSTLMAEIADKTHNVMAFTEIMQMIWKRLNDKSKNWRHVYKSLVLLEYLIKTGSDKVATQCRENIHSIETLRYFEYIEDDKDHGHNVREKARLLSALLRDEELLHEERTKALLARDRLMHGGLGTTSNSRDSPNRFGDSTFGRHSYPSGHSSITYGDKNASPLAPKSHVSLGSTDLESFVPQSAGEEHLHLQLALAISKVEHDNEERRRRAEEAKEEAKVQMVLEQSLREEQREKPSAQPTNGATASGATSSGGLFSLVDTSLSAAPAHLPDPWSTPLSMPTSSTAVNPTPNTNTSNSTSIFDTIPIDDPWSPKATTTAPQPNTESSQNLVDIWNLESSLGAAIFPDTSPIQSTSASVAPSTSLSDMNKNFTAVSSTTPNSTEVNGTTASEQAGRKRTPADFLGEHQRLVDLEKLIEKNPASTNPFTVGPRQGSGVSVNPFLANQPIKPSLNQLALPPPALAGPSESQLSNQMFYQQGRPFYPTVQPTHQTPVQSNPWPMNSSSTGFVPQQQTSLNPFY